MRANLNSGFGQIKRTLSRIYVFIPISKKSFCSVILFSCYFSSFRPSKARSIYFSFFANKILQGLDCLSCDDATSFFFVNWEELKFWMSKEIQLVWNIAILKVQPHLCTNCKKCNQNLQNSRKDLQNKKK